ncbi:uncharacterized protein LOC131381024 [Hylobates moloch]|uniref:uncharacterized protein LOC131381024 n=1 Tax=Hylobates moloch TaxID=81572 RepID=UPI002676268F|nr:uncharacterized protein LOC131381024 [Hylobates moloch]
MIGHRPPPASPHRLPELPLAGGLAGAGARTTRGGADSRACALGGAATAALSWASGAETGAPCPVRASVLGRAGPFAPGGQVARRGLDGRRRGVRARTRGAQGRRGSRALLAQRRLSLAPGCAQRARLSRPCGARCKREGSGHAARETNERGASRSAGPSAGAQPGHLPEPTWSPPRLRSGNAVFDSRGRTGGCVDTGQVAMDEGDCNEDHLPRAGQGCSTASHQAQEDAAG